MKVVKTSQPTNAIGQSTPSTRPVIAMPRPGVPRRAVRISPSTPNSTASGKRPTTPQTPTAIPQLSKGGVPGQKISASGKRPTIPQTIAVIAQPL